MKNMKNTNKGQAQEALGDAFLMLIALILLILISLFCGSCTKDKCQAPTINEFSGNVLYFQPSGNYTIEVQGIDGPYGGFIKATGSSQRIEGAKVKVRIKSDCSDWSEWVYKQ